MAIRGLMSPKVPIFERTMRKEEVPRPVWPTAMRVMHEGGGLERTQLIQFTSQPASDILAPFEFTGESHAQRIHLRLAIVRLIPAAALLCGYCSPPALLSAQTALQDHRPLEDRRGRRLGLPARRPPGHRLYLTRGARVDVLDTKPDKPSAPSPACMAPTASRSTTPANSATSPTAAATPSSSSIAPPWPLSPPSPPAARTPTASSSTSHPDRLGLRRPQQGCHRSSTPPPGRSSPPSPSPASPSSPPSTARARSSTTSKTRARSSASTPAPKAHRRMAARRLRGPSGLAFDVAGARLFPGLRRKTWP